MYTIKDRLDDYLAALESSDKDYDLELATQHFHSGVGVGFFLLKDIMERAQTQEQFEAFVRSTQDELSVIYAAQLGVEMTIDPKMIH